MPRKSISDTQRQRLRQWYYSQPVKPSQKQCIAWFKEQYNHLISQSTVSEALGDKFKHLDTQIATDRARNRPPQWPLLEAILFDFQKSIESNGASTTYEILRQKAVQIWSQIPQYRDQPTPDFSIGWLTKFNKRHNIKHRILHGEAGSVPVTAEEEMKAVRTLCGEYNEEDVYNMDETGLFWRSAVNHGLLSAPLPGRKQDRSRITLVCCTNSTGSDRLPLWCIGHAKQPRALKGVNVDALGCKWRNSRKAWMNTVIMIDWLKSFYHHIGSRTVILTMDNLKAHINAIEQLPPPSNIHIIWLPKNSTSVFQPLDQGIIQNLKVHYRKQWIQHIINCIDHNINPFTTVTVNEAVHWSSRAWFYHVNNTTIYNCFRKSTIMQPSITLPSEPPVNVDIEYTALQQRIPDVMSLQHILHPEDEDQEEETDIVILADIIAQHTQEDIYDEDVMLEDIEPQPIALPSPTEALAALQVLRTFQEHREETQRQDLRYLDQYERHLQLLVRQSQTQATLDRWLT
jgi:hypothetical protein